MIQRMISLLEWLLVFTLLPHLCGSLFGQEMVFGKKPDSMPPAAIVDPIPDQPGKVPQKIREYFERTDEYRERTRQKLENEIDQARLASNGARGDRRQALLRQLSVTEKHLETLKKTTITGILPDFPVIGDIGAFPELQVKVIINDDTLVAANHWRAVCVHPIKTKGLKVGQVIASGELVKVTADSNNPSPLLNDDRIKEAAIRAGTDPRAQPIVSDRNPITLVVEPLKKTAVEKYRKQFLEENANKK